MSISQNNLNKIEFFSKSHKDLSVFSNSFFNHVITPIYMNTDSLYSLVYIDLDEVDTYNSSYGRDFCDIAIDRTIKIIKDNLPSNSIISRIGGDEYIILLDNKSETQVNDIFNEISLKLKEKSKHMEVSKSQFTSEEKLCPSCLTMAYGICDSRDNKSFNDIYREAEKKEEFCKFIENTSGNYEDILNFKIGNSFKKFFNNFRFSNNIELTPDVVKTIGNTAIDSTISMISDPNYLKNVRTRSKNQKSKNNDSIDSIFESEEAKLIYDYVTCDKNLLPLSQFHLKNKLDNFLNFLICNPISGFFNKDYFNFYFKHIFQGIGDTKYSLVLFNLFGMKNCNRKLSFSGTNNLLKTYSSSLKEICENELGTYFSNTHFDISPFNNYIFDLGGGTFFIMISDYELSDDKFEKVADLSKYPKSPLYTFVNYKVCTSCDLGETFNSLVAESNQEEKKYKLGLIKSEETKLDLEEFMLDFVDYFLKNNEDLINQPFDKKKNFINIVFNKFLNQSIDFYKKPKCEKQNENKLNIKSSNNINIDEPSL